MRLQPQDYEGMDVAWLALDPQGHVAAFITAGAGPIPYEAVDTVCFAEDEALELPVRCEARLHVQVPNPSDFVALAERGLYVYDWSEPGARRSNAGIYRLAASPSNPYRHAGEELLYRVGRCELTISDATFGQPEIEVVV